jgi:anti-sigma-K factor RskA
MKLASPALIEHLASQYALGQLSPLAKRGFERYARDRADLRASISLWQERVNALASSVPNATPSAALWTRIEKQLFGEPKATSSITSSSTSKTSWWQRLGLIFNGEFTPLKLAGAGALGAMLAVFVMNAIILRPKTDDIAALQRDALPQSYVGLLLDSKEVATLLASSLRHGKTLTVKMLKPLPKDASVQYRLWAMPNEGAPFSVGLIPQSGAATIALPETSEKLFSKVQRLVVFAEPVGTSKPSPNGTPVLSGHCVKLW